MARVNQVGIGVMVAEILQRRAVHHRSGREAEHPFQNGVGIGPGDRRHGIEAHAQSALHGGSNAVEVEQALHQQRIVGDRIDDFDQHRACRAVDGCGADLVEIDRDRIGDHVAVDGQRARVDRFGDLLGCGAAIADVVFDAEIAVRPAGVVACGEHEPTEGLALPDQMRGGGRRQDAALADQQPAKAVGSGHADDGGDHLAVVVAPVAAEHEGCALVALKAVEHRLHEVLDIAGGLELGHALAKTGGAGLLTGDRRGGDGADHQRLRVFWSMRHNERAVKVGILAGRAMPRHVTGHAGTAKCGEAAWCCEQVSGAPQRATKAVRR